jgi:DNA-binding transcriptional LysR family regulator
LANGSVAEFERATQAIICTNIEAVRVAAVAGLGVAWAPDFLIDDALKSGQLVVVLRSEATEGAFWLLWPPSPRTSPRLRAFVDFAAARLFPDPAG